MLRKSHITVHIIKFSMLMLYFISLIKMLYWMVSKTESPLKRSELIHAIQRNFDGLDEFNSTEIFLTEIKSQILEIQASTINEIAAVTDDQQINMSTGNVQISMSIKNEVTDSIEIVQTSENEHTDTSVSNKNDQTADATILNINKLPSAIIEVGQSDTSRSEVTTTTSNLTSKSEYLDGKVLMCTFICTNA